MREVILLNFGRRLRFLRKQKGFSQEKLAFKANLHRTYIGMIERGEKNVTLISMSKLAKALEIELKYFFDE